jgi:hypothetical protein
VVALMHQVEVIACPQSHEPKYKDQHCTATLSESVSHALPVVPFKRSCTEEEKGQCYGTRNKFSWKCYFLVTCLVTQAPFEGGVMRTFQNPASLLLPLSEVVELEKCSCSPKIKQEYLF